MERRRVFVSDAGGALGTRVIQSLVTHRASAFEVSSVAGTAGAAVLLAAADPDTLARRRESLTARALDFFESIGDADHVVVVSSAMVYGAWANNPVPLTEDAVLRPDVDFAYARQLGAIEQMADEWRTAVPGRAVTVLRPAVVMAEKGTSGLARALAAGLGQRFGEEDPPAQFVHLDDLTSAVLLAVERRLDGVFNVAPDGFIAAEEVRALSGSTPRLKLPDRVAEVVGALRWRFQRGPIPPGLRAYTRSPWLIANDRLKAHGWSPTITNEQAYVEGTESKWWTMITPKRRQEISLAAMIVAALLAGAAVVAVSSRVRRRRRP